MLLNEYTPKGREVDLNKIPGLSRDILLNYLIPLNPNLSIPCLLNSLNAKISQITTFKRIKLKEFDYSSPKMVNYFALSFIPSGWGKDKIVNEIDYLYTGFKAYFKSANDDYFNKKEKEIRREAELKFPGSEKKQNDYFEKKVATVRDLRYEIKDGTPEGLYADCQTYQDSELGSVFIRIPELGLYLKNPTQQQQLFVNTIIELYEGKTSIKSTKMENRSSNIEGIPCNCLLYSDTEELLKDKANEYLMSIFDAGLLRRSFISYMPLKRLEIAKDYKAEKELQRKAFLYAENVLRDKIIRILTNITRNNTYTVTDEAYEIYHQYKKYNIDKYNNLLNNSDTTLLKELQGRFWKCLKLAVIIAATEHPSDLFVYPQDILYAVYQSELFALDLEHFRRATPKSDTDRLFYFFIENKNKWLTKKDIRTQRFVNNNLFKNWFDENIQYISEIAEEKGYTLKEETFNKNTGVKYMLVENNLGKEVSVNVRSIDDLIGV